ncbi:MAG: DUF1795 domain-containing protein [Ruminococcaceae bacterium]|nr:DUF1795 domain-containing protein [Oscillospiraceae bacterium]
MKKLIALILTFVLCIGVLCSCSNNDQSAPDGMKSVQSSDNLDYNIYIPEEWTQDLSTGVISAYCKSSDLSNISMTQFNLEDADTLDKHVEDYVAELEANLDEFKLSEGYPQKTLLGGVAASKIEYTAKLAGNEYKYAQIICIRKGTIYFFTYTSNVNNFDSHAEDIKNILDNFSFR